MAIPPVLVLIVTAKVLPTICDPVAGDKYSEAEAPWASPVAKCKKIFYKYSEKFTALFKNKIICVSEFDKIIAIKEKICNKKKLITIHNGIKEINFLSKEEALEKLIPNTQHPTPNIVIGTIANLYKTKGLKYLIESIKILLTLNSKILTIIIGEGPERKNLENLINKYNLKNNIILAGNIKNAATLLKAFDIYVCSSIKEGLSYTLIEAMRAGLPIIATNVGGNSELIKDNKTGILIKSKNQEDLAKNINKLINNKNLQKKISEEGKLVSINFRIEKMLRETKKIYNKKEG